MRKPTKIKGVEIFIVLLCVVGSVYRLSFVHGMEIKLGSVVLDLLEVYRRSSWMLSKVGLSVLVINSASLKRTHKGWY